MIVEHAVAEAGVPFPLHVFVLPGRIHQDHIKLLLQVQLWYITEQLWKKKFIVYLSPFRSGCTVQYIVTSIRGPDGWVSREEKNTHKAQVITEKKQFVTVMHPISPPPVMPLRANRYCPKKEIHHATSLIIFYFLKSSAYPLPFLPDPDATFRKFETGSLFYKRSKQDKKIFSPENETNRYIFTDLQCDSALRSTKIKSHND